MLTEACIPDQVDIAIGDQILVVEHVEDVGPELEPAPLYDLSDDEPNGLVPCYTLSPLGRAGYQVVEAAYRRAKQMELLDARPNVRNSTAALTPNLGRGSP